MSGTHIVLYVLGEPGVGKTSVVRHLLRDVLERDPDGYPGPLYEPVFTAPPAPKWTTVGRPERIPVAAAGWYTGSAFDGADTIPYNGARAALEYWRTSLLPVTGLTILDGARFATKPSLAFLQSIDDRIPIRIIGVHLVAPNDAAARRAKRAELAGVRQQSKNWVKGAATGARNFAALIHAREIDASKTSLWTAGTVLQLVDRARAEAG